MRRMWGDSINSVQGQHARITYDDFLLLMKGQTKEAPSLEKERELETTVSGLLVGAVGAAKLHSVHESSCEFDESPVKGEESNSIVLPSGDIVSMNGQIQTAVELPGHGLGEANDSPNGSSTNLLPSQSAPTTPADHRRIMNLEMGSDSPFSMDEDDDLVIASGPGVPGSSASLTPPSSPTRGATDYTTPGAQRRAFCNVKDMKASLDLPGLPPSGTLGMTKPPKYTRRRSRSLDEQDETLPEKQPSAAKDEENSRLSVIGEVAEVVHGLQVSKSERTPLSVASQYESKSALGVNRKLYRAHRQMRLAVLEASKRFEEQQAEHAKEVILAAREEDENYGMIQAGLVMRHGHKKQVSSKSIRTLLDSNRVQQQALVEKANKRAGRGRRSRKKTFSDIGGMLTSAMGPEDLGNAVVSGMALESVDDDMALFSPELVVPEDEAKLYEDMAPEAELSLSEQEGLLRSATVPGEFRKTSDPFGVAGRYGALASTWK